MERLIDSLCSSTSAPGGPTGEKVGEPYLRAAPLDDLRSNGPTGPAAVHDSREGGLGNVELPPHLGDREANLVAVGLQAHGRVGAYRIPRRSQLLHFHGLVSRLLLGCTAMVSPHL